MRSFPPEVILSWPVPNYTNPTTRGDALLVVNLIFISIAVIVVGLRLYTRIWIKRWFGLDDIFISLALLFTIGLAATVLLANQQYGWDRHVYDIPFTKLVPTSKIAMAAKVIFTTAATFTRLSLLFFYYRLIPDGGKSWFRVAIHLNVAFTVAIEITFIFLGIFQCIPVKNYWIFGAPADTCMDEGAATLAAGIINCTADFFCTIIPIPLVMTLQMPRRQRIAVGLLFSLGFIVTIAGIVRTWYIYKSLILEYDQTWYAYPLWIAAAIEIDLGVICASAPVLRPLLARLPFSLCSLTSNIMSKTRGPSGSSQNRISKSTARMTIGSKTSRTKVEDTCNDKTTHKEEEGSQFEMNRWVDVEQGHRPSRPHSHGSEDAILREVYVRPQTAADIGGQPRRLQEIPSSTDRADKDFG